MLFASAALPATPWHLLCVWLRGCPFIILEGVYDGNKALHSEASKQRLNRLLEEFDLWEAPTAEASVDDTGRGRAADDPVELL